MTKDVPLPTPNVVNGLPKNKEALRVYPNPFSAELYVDGVTSAHATFINTPGQIIMRSPIVNGQPLNTTTLPVGFYILHVADPDGRSSVFKIIRH